MPWNFDTVNNPSNQVAGTDELVYSAAINNVPGFVTRNIDGATVFPSETGVLTLKMKLDLSNYPTTNSDFSGPNLVEIATSGNKSGFINTLGKVYTFGVGGFNNPGEFRFPQSVAWIFLGGARVARLRCSRGDPPPLIRPSREFLWYHKNMSRAPARLMFLSLLVFRQPADHQRHIVRRYPRYPRCLAD